MLKISHIKIRPIHIILGMFLVGCWTCYMPRGAFMIKHEMIFYNRNDSLKLILPVEFQVYNYFRITYVKNMDISIAEKINDSTIVFLPKMAPENIEKLNFRVEGGIVPFSPKKE